MGMLLRPMGASEAATSSMLLTKEHLGHPFGCAIFSA